MDKVKYRAIQNAWRNFDRSTALGCAQRNAPFDQERMQLAWNQYNTVLAWYGISPFFDNPNHPHQS